VLQQLRPARPQPTRVTPSVAPLARRQ